MRCVNKMVRFVVKRTMRAIPSIGDSVFLREKEARRVKPIYGGRTMKTYTQADFDTFEVDKFGRKICPAGDYTNIKDFVEYCVFDRHCLFGAQCRFIEHCRFGDGCYFGDECSFGAYCYFGAGCEFGKECRFGELCGFGEGSTFGEGCSFGDWCTFGECCNFGEGCNYENGNVKNGHYVAVDRIGNTNQKVYFYIDENGNMFVRAGCWFTDMATFKGWVKKVHVVGTTHEKIYMAACDLAELMLKDGNEDYLKSGKKGE